MQAGDYFAEKYLIEGILGRGGMGTVYLAKNVKTGSHWAVKEINNGQVTDTGMPSEASLLARLDHPALPRLYDLVEQDGKLYMITDYIDGISLDRKLEAEGRIAEDTVIDWAIQLCMVLDYLHSIKPNPVIYRDIKPSNIMLTGSGMLKLIDFGTAREYKPQSDADTVYIGTRGYAAPEQFGTGQTSAVSDIYSLGVTLHHLVTGKSPVEPPFRLEPIRSYDPSLSLELEAVILKCTCESPSGRYQSAAELLADLNMLRERKSHVPDGDAGSVLYQGMGSASYQDHRMIAGRSGFRASGMAECAEKEHDGTGEAFADISVPDDADQERHTPVYSFRRMVITVWDNAEFGCELAYTAAKLTGSEVLLADLDLLAPKADLILNVCKYPPQLAKNDLPGRSGLDIVMDAAEKRVLTPELLRRAAETRKEMKNLYIITGNYRLDNYEYYSEDSVTYLIDKCYRYFDITVLLVNRSIYDAFTLAALLRSDVNIAAVKGETGQLREFNTYIAFLDEKQHLPPENTKFVLFEYDGTSDISKAEAAQATQGNLLGTVSFSRKRVLYRNMNSAYVCHMEKDILRDYSRIHKKLGFMPSAGFMPVLKIFGNLAGGMNRKKSRPMEG
ncbi:MAG TPA: serine/threonine-protein kinase [Clostridia bacterium]